MKSRFLMVFAAAALLFVASSCTKGEGGNDGDTTLELKLSSESINIDKSEKVTFTVLSEGKDVTADAKIINTTGGGYEVLAGNTFSTFRPGIHEFYATYGSASSTKVSLLAKSTSDVSDTFYRRNLIVKFTGTWCSACPAMTIAIDQARNIYPDRLVEVAVHGDDALDIGLAAAYRGYFDVTGYPSAYIDFMPNDYPSQWSAAGLIAAAKQSTADYPTTVGIKASVSVSDSNMLSVDTEAMITEDGSYKILVMTTRSGFNYEQSGTTDASYRQNHVARGFFTQSEFGDPLGDLVKNQRVQKHYELQLSEAPDEATLENTDIVVIIFKKADSIKYYVNNVITCKIGESADYEYEPIEE